jgi:tetratricopeptide (TPR) repeat protein
MVQDESGGAAGGVSFTYIFCGEYSKATAKLDEVATLADEKRASQWTAIALKVRGCLFLLTGRALNASEMIASGLGASPGSKTLMPWYLANLARAHAELGNFDEAWRCIGEATTTVKTTKERWFEAEIYRMAGEIALKSPSPDAAKAEAYFEHALAVAQAQQAKSWELRAAMSMARLWRDQGKRDEARDLLAPVYGWFTEGFDTRDLKEAKALHRALLRNVAHPVQGLLAALTRRARPYHHGRLATFSSEKGMEGEVRRAGCIGGAQARALEDENRRLKKLLAGFRFRQNNPLEP